MDAHAIQSLDIALRLFAIELVDDVAHADVRTDFQCARHVDIAIAATPPVVVLHRTAVHHFHTAARMDDIAGVNHLVVKCH